MKKTALLPYYDTFACTGQNQDNPSDLVLIHGWGMHSAVWDELIPPLLEQYQVTVIDLPGLGRSPMPGGDYNLDYLVEQVAAVAPPRAIWVGWSLGGLVASRLALQQPERVMALITIASSPCFVSSKRWPLAMNEQVLQKFREVLQEDWEGTLIRFLALQCKDSQTIKSDIRYLKDIVFLHGLPAQKALREGLKILAEVDLLDDIGKIGCPVLHVFGENDNLVPVGVSKDVLSYQPKAKTAVIKGVSHVPFISAPDLVAAALVDFLQGESIG